MRRALRIVAGLMLIVTTAVAIWDVLLIAGVKAYPAGNFLADARRLDREAEIIVVLAGIAAFNAIAVAFSVGWPPRPRLVSLGWRSHCADRRCCC